MATIARLEPFRGISTLQDQFNRLLNESFRNPGEESALTTWAPAVDIYETTNELVVKADLPDVNEKDIDVRVENNLLTIRGERKFEKVRIRGKLPARSSARTARSAAASLCQTR